ncbi:vascular non-inflammatory molecule 3 [Trichonephila inaurata madagascariensis]|uniref:Vascular non-inflammatory molecule 3 n=1 Tax=Trichonephila inaurata madagascariensis TaxID=2747483 RepID=A0A8X6XGJ6_9ARAC|nr:vascular non-inflammatory molecule 3 [Trichonephila inaurata madagascariensis]
MILKLIKILVKLQCSSGIRKVPDCETSAVFEHRPVEDLGKEPFDIKSANLEYYAKATKIAAQKGADIIVFNEYGTFPYPFSRENFTNFAEHVPDPNKQKFNPCTENAIDRPALHTASCLARKNGIYIVMNLADIQPCEEHCDADKIDSCSTECPEDGMYLYNTDVAFDREGNIIARYYKMHPYFEVVNIEPNFVTFDTDFGKFGMIVCFDSVFEESVRLVKEYGIDTLLFPTYWFDDIVPFDAVEFQQSWAIANDVNFIASNTHYPGTGSLGSGIYSKKDGALVYTYEPDGKSKLLIANVPIKGGSDIPDISSITVVTRDDAFLKEETGDKFPEECYDKLIGPAKNEYEDYRCFKQKLENYTLTKLEKPAGKIEACNNGFCCSLSYSARELQEDFYLAAFNGLNNVRGYYQWWEEVCILTRCDSFEGKPCALLPPRSKTVFEKLKLKGHFKAERVYPTVSNDKARLAPKKKWDIKRDEDEVVLTYKSNSDEPLLRAGLLGRDYERDPPFIPYYPNKKAD